MLRQFALLTLLLGATPVAAQQAPAPAGQRVTYSVSTPEGSRAYQIYVPRSLSRVTTGRSAVVLLHGGEGNVDVALGTSRIISWAEARGFVVILPATGGRPWSDGRAVTEGYDDVGYIEAVVAQAAAANGITPSRIFVAGLSSGGMMTQRLACESSDVFAGGASAIANLPWRLLTCDPERRIPMVLEFGGLDPLARPEGSGEVISRDDTVSYWTEGCSAPQMQGEEQRFSSCPQAAPRLVIVDPEAGHEWPPYLTEEIVNFFAPEGLGQSTTGTVPPRTPTARSTGEPMLSGTPLLGQ
jgi:poly(3-hydroxybutyrate) depolymerase